MSSPENVDDVDAMEVIEDLESQIGVQARQMAVYRSQIRRLKAMVAEANVRADKGVLHRVPGPEGPSDVA